jgi:hypothetical protein
LATFQTGLRKAEKLIIGCEGCAPDDAELPFDNVLDRVTGNDPSITDYIFMEAMAKCPFCRRETNEKSLVELERRYFIAIAVVAFLLFLGVNGYQLLCPLRWGVGCGVPDSSGMIVQYSGPIVHTEAEAKKIVADAVKLGRICFVNPIRECVWMK